LATHYLSFLFADLTDVIMSFCGLLLLLTCSLATVISRWNFVLILLTYHDLMCCNECSIRSTQPGHPSVAMRNEYQRKLGHKQAHHAMHDPHIRGLAV